MVFYRPGIWHRVCLGPQEVSSWRQVQPSNHWHCLLNELIHVLSISPYSALQVPPPAIHEDPSIVLWCLGQDLLRAWCCLVDWFVWGVLS